MSMAKTSACWDRYGGTSLISLAPFSCVMLKVGVVVMTVEGDNTINFTSVALVVVTQNREDHIMHCTGFKQHHLYSKVLIYFFLVLFIFTLQWKEV